MKFDRRRSFRVFAVLVPVLCALGVVPGAAGAAWVSLGGVEGSEVDVRVIESAAARTVLEITIPGFDAAPIEIDGATYYRLGLEGESNLLDTGLPELPHVCRSVLIPDGERMEIRVLEAEYTEIEGMPVVPSKGNLPRTIDPADVPYSFGPAYASDAWYPERVVRDREPYVLRDYRGLVADVVPFQTRARSGRLRVAHRMVVEIDAAGPGVVNTIDRAAPPASIATQFAELYRLHFVNWGGARYTPVEEIGGMLVITHDDFHSALLPLVEWKTQQGIPTELVDVSSIGNNEAAIDALIEQRYLDEGIAFVLLVGDAAQVATTMNGGNESDPSYALIEGNDSYPELFVGRFSAETLAHAETQVERSVAYEKTPMEGASWYHKGTGIASDQGPGDDGEYDDEHQDVIRGKLLGYGYTEVDQIYDPYATAAQVAAALNEGRSIVDYTGHGSQTSWGSSGFSSSHVNSLTNDWMLPFIISVACVNGDFGGLTCFAEAWLRATNGGVPTGAIGAYMSSISQSWNPPMCAQDEVVDLLVGDEMTTYGGLCFNGSCQMIDEYGNSGASEFKAWHVFGDPSLLVRTRTPDPLTVQHGGTLLIGQDAYEVTVAGVEGARCALYGDGILYGVALTGPGGTAAIPIDPPLEEPGSLTLTVTRVNGIPAIEAVEVIPPDGPFLVFSESTVLDAPVDGDGICDAGETNGLRLRFANVGVEDATGISAVLSSADEHVVVTTGEQAIEDIPPDSTGACLEPFVIEIDPMAPDGHVALFTVAIQADQGEWEAGFSLPIQAPVLTSGAFLINDAAPGGDGNGTADPGETITVQLTLPNVGQSDARQLQGVLSSMHPAVLVHENEGICLRAPAGGEGIVSSFVVELRPECPSPAQVDFHLALSCESGFEAGVDYELSVGAFRDDVEEDRGWTAGAAGDDASTGRWVRADPVGTTYNGQPCQPEDDHTLDPGSICFVTGNGSVGGGAGDADVDGGKTTLLTPVFDLGDAVSATIEYWRWYTNDLGNNPGQDTWRVEITANGTDWVVLEETMESANEWTLHSFVLEDFIPLTAQVQLRFVASDEGSGSLVEAAVDDFTLAADRLPVTGAGEIPPVLRSALVSCGPNPFNPRARIVYRSTGEGSVDLALYDVGGRRVRTLIDRPVAAGEHTVVFDGRDGGGAPLPSGIYFVRLATADRLEVRQVTLLK
ncbi:MAG: hypothetical protein GF346_09345 [Candidatus Eisenbacteria bacterium]|nr:hypothetical protein [Candidatus Latescibacterota bacterium]MBD3302636.1 hypothetical protein [Candidatus Eisenbacteria bacterium]